MASVALNANGTATVQVFHERKRRTIHLGKVTEREARRFADKVERLATSIKLGNHLDPRLAEWLDDLCDDLHDRLARAGLVTPRADVDATMLGAFIDAYIASRTDAKPRTIINLKRARKMIAEHFGEARPLARITPGDADGFRLALLGKGLAENTVRRICGRARQFLGAAIRRDLVRRNPFEGIKCTVGGNRERMRFISIADAEKVLAACPDAEWRLIFALSRYAGMRCPSEHLALRWGDVNWEQNRMTVRSPKTEHYEGKASRVTPIFPELLPHLRHAFEAAEPGTQFVINRCRDSGVNLRTQFERIVRRAGLEPWPKLFHNLRATRQTELAEHFALHVVCAWLGNSSAIAAKHYLQVTEDHFERAAQFRALQNALQHGAATACTEAHEPHSGAVSAGVQSGAAEKYPREDSNLEPAD